MGTGYEYDIFISYRRHEGWPEWVEENFLPIFKHWVGEELGRPVRIFVDTQIETGKAWPQELATAHSNSAIVVPLLCATYFDSDWCKLEYALMEDREGKTGSDQLVVPATVHDGDRFSANVSKRQSCILRDYVRMRMAAGSPLAERLEDEIISWAPDVADAVRRAPNHDPKWAAGASTEFETVFKKKIRPRKPSW